VTSADLRRTWALVPLRGLENAKTRLGAELDAEERLELVVAMARRTLAAARDAQRIAGTVLVTADPAAAELGASLGAHPVVQRLPGLNAALREARATAVRAGATAILVLPIDLPGVTPDELDLLLRTAAVGATTDRPLVLAVPDRHGSGTNALLVSPPAAIEPAFGEGSFSAHRLAAEAAGANFIELGGRLTLDVDTAADLLAAELAAPGARRGSGTDGGRGAA
jgi:2-phospho-L-lactate guanylyltransferase